MIDVKAKAKPLYFILVALVMISLTTIIAGTTNTDNSTETIPETWSFFTLEDEFILGEPVDFYILPSNADYYITITNPDTTVMNISGLRTYPKQIGVYESCASITYESETREFSTVFAVLENSSGEVLGGKVYNQGQAIKEENKQLGQKLQDEPDYETHFLSIEKTADYLFVTFYHDYNGILPVRVEGDVNYTLSKESIDYLENATLVVGLVEEIIPKFKLHVGPESEVFEFGKSIPTVDIENGNYTLEDRDDSKLNVEITSDNEKIDLEGIEDQSLIIANIEKVDDAEITTSVAAVQPIDIEQATITLEKTGDVNAILRCDDDKLDYDTMQCSEWVKTDIPFTDNGDTITFTVDHFSGYAGGYITIINVQSYPMVGGNWTVRFTTDGTANLTITAIDGTGFGADLEFLELKCGDIILNADYDGTRIFYEDYQCDEEGSETSLVLTPGEHHLMFEFGDSVGYANNSATNIYNFVKPTVVNVSGSVNITVFWSEPTENMTLFICRYNDCLECYQGPDGTPTQTDGCLCWNSEQRYTSSNCTYQTQENDPSQVSFWIKLYNASQYGPSSVPANYGSSPEPNTTGFQVNHRPNATNIVITPSSANKSSTLSCGYTFYDQDGDAELAGSVQYKWWVGGIDIGVTTSTLSNQYFNKTNVTICGVKVTDNHGFPDDRHENSSGVTIQNSPPTKPSITIDPSAPSVGQDVYCNVTTNSTDADSDAVNYTYRWINGSTLVRTFGPTAQIYDMLGSGNTSYGETWICNVTPFDGEVSGISKSANFTIGNTAPEARNVTINSTDNLNRTNGTLTGGWDFYDIDSDSESAYETRWYENNTEQAGFRNQTQISSADTTKGEKWRFSVRVYDGMVWSAWVNSTNLTIVNAIPEHSTPILNTTLPANSSAANLTCYPQSVSDKDNDDVKNIFNWYKDSVSIAVLNMPFEGGSNSTWTKDYSGHNNGTVVGANWSSSAGYDGKGAYEFDGADDHINLTLTNLTTFTYSARIKVESFGGGTGFIMDMDNWAVAFYVYNSSIWPNSLLFYVDNVPGDSEVTANNSIQLGRWHHVAGTFDGTQLKLYFDGELVDCNTTDSAESTTCTDFTTTIPGYTNFHLTLGNEKGGSDFFNGTIDDVMIFNRSLSAAQIKALYENRTDLIAPDETNKGETWHVQVTPNDGEADGATLTSNSITLINYVPTHSTPLLSSTRGLNSSGGNLTCNAVNLIDIDNDDIKQTINWYVNDASILVLNMPFDMNHTTNNITRDYTIFENNGTVINATWNSTGGYDGKGAYMFNGSNDYINCGNDSSLQFGSGNFTLSAWVKTESSSSQIILMKGDGAADIYYYLRMNNGNISVTAGDGSQYTVTSASTYNDGNWHFATGVRDGNNLRLYVDGVEDPNSPTDISSLTSTDYGEDLVIGRYGPSSMWYFNGTIDDVMIFNRSLSAEQIKALYENRTNLLVSQETRGSEAWKCDITPNDGELEAATLTSNTLTLKATPIINVSNISRIVATNYPTLTFSITGDNEINISSVLLYVYGVNSTYHTLVGSTYYDSYGWTFGSNITCTGNDTYYDCTLTLDNITSGHYNLTFSVKDIGDDTGYAYIYNYIVDTTPPVILKVFNGYYDGKGHISTHATIETLFANWTYEEDNESGIAYFEYSVGTAKYPNSGWNNTKGWTRVNATNNSVSVALDLTHMWVYYFNVRAINNASLVSDVVSSSGVLYQDVTAPACPGWSASTGGGCIHDDGVWTRFDASLHAYWNFTDNGSTIVMYEYAIGTRAFDGSMINYSNIAGPNQTSNSDVTVYGLELEYNKTYYWNVRAKNENGKWSQWYYSDNITVDNVKPYNGSISYPAINTTINVTTVTINTGTDDLSQVGTVVLQKSRAVVTEGVCGGFANYETVNISLGQGQYSVGVNLDTGYCHKFRLVVYDYAGNSETYYYSGGESFYVDTTPPEGFAVSLNNGAFWTTQQQLVINWSPAYDPESGIDYYAYYVNDSLGRTIWQWTNTTGTYASLTNLSMQHLETSIAYVRAYNPVGLSVMNFSNAVLYKDTVPPNPVAVISVETDTNSSDGWLDTVNNGNTNITALADEPELTCYLTEGDMDYSSAEAYGTRCNTSSYNINCNISLSEGTYTYHITCRDQHEGEQSASQNTQVSFIVDWSAPNITITNPSPGEIMGEIINFEIDISDERGVDSAWYYIMNTSWNTTGDLTSPWDFTWDSSTVSDGNYTLLVYANDTGGLTGNASVNFTVDNTIPAIDIFYPDPDNKFFNSDFNLNLSVRNTFVNTSYSITNASGALMQNNTNTSNVSRTSHDWTDNVNISGWPDGNYTLLLYAVDIVGNDLSKTFVFYTDQTAPQYSKIARTPDPVYNDMDVQLNTTWPNPFNTIANQYDLSLVIFSHNASGTWTNITTPIDPDNVFTATISSSLLNNSETVYWYSYARDFVGNSNQTPMQTFTVQNRVPVFNGTIPDQSWPEDTDNTNINLSSYYSDQDNDDLSYSYLLMPRGTLLYDMLENETDVNAIGGSISNAGFVGGKYADGILMEATSTNLIINPSFEDNSSGLDNWTAVNSPKYNTTNASNTSFGVASVRVNLNNHYEQVVEVDANAVYTLSEYLKSETGTMTGRLHIHWLNSSRAFISTNICATGNCSSKPTINTSYVRYQTTETAPANAAYARIIIDNSNASYVWVDAVQFEKKPYATSFVTGARAEGTLMYNTTIAARDNFNPAAGTVEMWVKPEWDGNDTGTHWFFREYNDTGNYFLFGKRQSAQLVFEINSSITIGNSTYSNYSYTTADISSWVKDEWHFIAATWNNSIGNMSIYIDGKLKNTSTGIVTPTSLAMYMYAGYQADSVIDEFAVFDYAKTPGEIARDNTTQITQGLNISVSISSGIVTLTPVDYWFGEHRINFFGSDGHSKTGSNNVNLEVTEDNPRFLNAINDSDTFQRYHNFTANITIRDDHGLSVYIFSTNVNGSWVNETVSISGRERNASESRNITVSQGNLVCWYYWANDSAGYSNKSTTHCFTVVNTVPTIAAIILNATTEGNWTYDNLTLHIINTTDVDNDEVKNIINWYVDNASITLLNMPFEGGSLSGNSSGVPNATKDYSSYANNVTIVNATWDAAGGYDGKGAYSFDGDDYINVTSLSTLGITQVMWVKNSSDTAWHHVANVSGTQYIDGVVATGRLIPISNSAGTVIIGMNYSGTIDDVMIFNRSLSAAQIKALYENRTDLTVSDETVKNETWYAAVTPNDGTADGATYYSNNLTISNINTPPYFTHSLTTQTAYVGVNFTYDINASDKDPGETVTYSINTTKLSINDTTGLINWTAPTTTESLDVNVTICDDSGASNNCTSDTFTINVYTLSTIENSTINGTFYSSNVTADIPGIVGSTINLSTISGPTIDITDSNIYNSTIINSTILRCNITDSTLNNMDCVDTVIDPSNLKESNTTRSDITGSHVWYSNITDSNITDSTIDYSDITDSNITDSTITNSTIENSKIINDATVTDSTIVNSTIDNSTITNSTITNSTIINSTILDAVVANANISDGVLHSGNVTWGGTNTAGPENLTDIINYAPTAVINASPPSGTSSVTVTFNATLSTDPNIPGDLNDVLNYTWDFTTDGTPDNYSNVTSYTYGVGTHTATLTVTDKFGKSDSATATIAVSSSGGTGGVSGGGGGGGAGVTTTTIQLTEAGVEACLRANDQAAFTFDQVMHTITLTQLGDNYAVLDMPSVEGNLLSGRILLYVNESAKYDLNKNQYYDFYMKLDRIQYGRGCLMMKSIHEPIQPIPAPVPVVGVEEGPEEEPTAPMPRPPRQVTTPKETYTPPVISKPPLPETNLRNIILSVLPIALIAAALLGVVLYKRSSRAVVEEGMSGIEKYVSSALNKGKHIHDIHNDLLEKGWPEESIYAAELKHVILQASKKMSIKDIQNELINKGWPKDMVKAAVLGHFVKEHLTKGKSFEHVKGKLMNAGWKEQEIHQHLKKAK